MQKISLLFVILSFFLGNSVDAQQLPNSSIFDVTNFRSNPAMTASGEYLEWGVTYRQQWLGFEQAPQTGSAYVQYPLIYQNMSIGGSIGYDEAGPLRDNDISLTYSYKLSLSHHGQLSAGILARLNQYRFNGSRTLAFDSGDPLLLEETSTALSPNFGIGLFYVSNVGMYDLSETSFFIGIGSNQLLSNQLIFQDDSKANLERAFHANGVIGARIINNIGYVEPSIWLNYAENNLLHGSLRLNIEVEDLFWGGVSYATDSTVGLQIGYVLNNSWLGGGQLRIGTSGNYNLGILTAEKGLGFEILVGYQYGL